MESLIPAYLAAGVSLPDGSVGYLRSISRRFELMEFQRDFLKAIDWNVFWNVGTYDYRSDEQLSLQVHIKNPSGRHRLMMTVSCREIAITFLYKAFDDITSGAVNALDTMGRFVNLVHRLGIPERRASLGELRKQLQAGCQLAHMLDGSSDFLQLNLLRPIRGALQHSAFEHILRRPEAAAGEHGVAPRVADDFELKLWSGDRPVPRFADRVVASVESLLRSVSQVLGDDPRTAVQAK